MERVESTDPSDLNRPEGNDLQSNYSLHDVGEERTVGLIEATGLRTEAWGIDKRDDDGEGIIYDDAMDIKVFDDETLVGLVDVKTKSGPKYMGMFNERHYVKYHGHSDEFDVPAYVAFWLVTDGDVVDSFVLPIRGNELYDGVMSSTNSDAVRRFPDGNEAVMVPNHSRISVATMINEMSP